MNSNISNKDKKDWENFLSKNETLPNKDKANIKVRGIKIKSCDLHGYSLDQANKKIKDLINNSYNEGVNKLIIITGKGIHSQNDKNPYISKNLGILKHSVPEFIYNNKELMELITDIKDAVDIVDVFRPSAEAIGYAEESIKIGAKVLWLQLGIRSNEAKRILEGRNITYIENRCTKIEYQKIFLQVNPAFPVLQD